MGWNYWVGYQEGMRYLKIGQAVKGFVDFVGKINR